VPVFAHYSIVEWHRCALLGSRYGHTPLESGGFSGPSLQLGTDTVAVSDHIRVHGVTISSDLVLAISSWLDDI